MKSTACTFHTAMRAVPRSESYAVANSAPAADDQQQRSRLRGADNFSGASRASDCLKAFNSRFKQFCADRCSKRSMLTYGI